MKKLILYIVLFCTVVAYADIYVGSDKVNINKYRKLNYIIVKMDEVGNDVWPEVDYGQTQRNKETKPVDFNGDRLKFNSKADVLNFFYRKGWRLINTYVNIDMPTETIYNTEYFIFEKK